MGILTDKNVRLLVGLLSSLTLLALIIADALLPEYSMTTMQITLLTALIWSFLGIDVLQRNSSPIKKARRVLPKEEEKERD